MENKIDQFLDQSVKFILFEFIIAVKTFQESFALFRFRILVCYFFSERTSNLTKSNVFDCDSTLLEYFLLLNCV
jgi:hypothetical protein